MRRACQRWVAAAVLLTGGGAAAADAPVHLVINGRPVDGQPSLIAQVCPSIVGVAAVTHDDTAEIAQVTSGRGVAVAPDGVIVTNHHVIAGADTIYVVTDAHQTLTVPMSSDQIVAVDGRAMHTSSDVLAAINDASAGTTLAVTVPRGGQQLVLQVTLVQRPAGR